MQFLSFVLCRVRNFAHELNLEGSRPGREDIKLLKSSLQTFEHIVTPLAFAVNENRPSPVWRKGSVNDC